MILAEPVRESLERLRYQRDFWWRYGLDARHFLLCDLLDGVGFAVAHAASRAFRLVSPSATLRVELYKRAAVPARLPMVEVVSEGEFIALCGFIERHWLVVGGLVDTVEPCVPSISVLLAAGRTAFIEHVPIAALNPTMGAA